MFDYRTVGITYSVYFDPRMEDKKGQKSALARAQQVPVWTYELQYHKEAGSRSI